MSGSNISVPLYFITGFLGSGKTTLLNRVLNEAAAQGKKTGVIVNEWGQASVDSVIIHANNVEIEELNNGQVFCSCLSADFIRVLALYAERDLDAVVVETSGMANPMPLHKLLLDLEKVTGQHYAYKGMTALVDPESFLDLAGAIHAVDEQIMASHRIIINKVDLTDKSTLVKIHDMITTLNPKVAVIETSFARIDTFFDDSSSPVQPRPLFRSRPMPQNVSTFQRPGNFLVKTDSRLAPQNVEKFFLKILPASLRMKGIFQDENGVWRYTDGVNGHVTIQNLGYSAKAALFIIIPRPGAELENSIRQAWVQYCAVEFSLS